MGIRSDSGIWQYLASEIIGSAETVASALNRLADTVHTQVLALKNRMTAVEGRATALEGRLPNWRRFALTRSGIANGVVTNLQLSSVIASSPNAFGYTLGTEASVANASITLPPGIYTVSAAGALSEPVTARSFLECSASIGKGPRQGIVTQEDGTSFSFTVASTGSILLRPRIYRQSGASSVSFDGEVIITRLGAAA